MMSDREMKSKGRQRASTPRSKTGCITCKMRRLKCGEEKPGCERCKKSGWQCDGYEHGSSSRLTVLPRTPSPRSSVYVPSVPLALDDQERRYFQAYVEQKHTAAPYKNHEEDLWKHTVLQECATNPCVQHALVAQGALLVSQVAQKPWASYFKTNPAQDKHHDFALTQYDKALRVLRHAIGELTKGKGARSTLISALALAFFDLRCGNSGFAAQHIRFGRKLLAALRFRGDYAIFDHSKSCLESAMSKPSVEEDIELSLPSNFDAMRNHRRHVTTDKWLSLPSLPPSLSSELSSRNDNPIDEYILRMYFRIDANVSIFFGVDVECDYDNACIINIPPLKIPTEFTSFEEAQRARAILLDHVYQFFLGISKYRFQLKEQIPDNVRRFRAHWITQILAWEAAFRPLLTNYVVDKTVHPFSRPGTIRIHVIALLIWITGTLHPPGSVYDALMPHFEYLVSIAEEAIEFEKAHSEYGLHLDSVESYSFGVHIVPALYLTATKCRLNSLRYRAISLLLSSRRREFIWDSILCGRVAQWLFRLEEDASLEWDGLGRAPQKMGGFVDEDRRVWGETIERDLQGRRAVVRCRQNVPMVRGGGWTELSTVVEW